MSTPHIRIPRGEVIVELRNVTKCFGDRAVLDDVSCSIRAGETTVIIGPSGTGKSVFLKHLVGLLRPDSGQVLVAGQDVPTLDDPALFELRKRFGMLFQDGALFDSMSVGENIAFPLRHHTAKSDDEIARRVAEVLAMVGLPGIEEREPAALSGGMRKRVGLARAIALEPEIVLFDEPHSGLDPVMSDTIDKLIVSMKARLGSTFIVISHDIAGTFQIADTIGMLWKGKLIAFGPKQEVMESQDPVLRQFFERRADGPMTLV